MGAPYAIAIALSAIGVRALLASRRVPLRREVAAPLVVATVLAFLLVDVVGLARGWFATPAAATLGELPGRGPLGRGFPVEEPLLLAFLAFLVYALAELSNAGPRERRRIESSARAGLVRDALLGLAAGLVLWQLASDLGAGEYTAASGGLLAGSLVAARELLSRRSTHVTLGLFLALTVAFDSLLCALGLFSYPPAPRSGLVVGLAPVEDLLYGAAFALVALRLRAHLLGDGGRGWRILLASRPISWINTGLPFLAALVAAGAGEALGAWLLAAVLWWGGGYNLFLYGINDYYDRATDRHNPRKGGAEGALLTDGDARALVPALLLFGALPAMLMLILLPGGPAQPANWMPLAALFAAALYSAPWLLRARSIPLLDALVSSTHFLAPVLAGLLFAPFDADWLPVLAAYALWNAASQVVGALQDEEADRRSGLRTTATALGARGAARLACLGYLAAALVLLFAPWPLMRLGALLPLASAGSVALALRGRWGWQRARDAWRRFLWLNLPLGAGATLLLLASWQQALR